MDGLFFWPVVYSQEPAEPGSDPSYENNYGAALLRQWLETGGLAPEEQLKN
jgi:hypothetical protein